MITRIDERVKSAGSEGIFSIPGSAEKVEKLVYPSDSFQFADAAAIALICILDKGAIFTPVQLQKIYEALNGIETEGNKISSNDVRGIMDQLKIDDGKLQVLNRLIPLFKKLVDNKAVTKMGVSNLATTVGTHLFFPIDPLRSIVISAVLRQTGGPDGSQTVFSR